MNMMSDAIDLLYLDDSLLALNKPSGLLSVPGRGPDKQDCASERARQLFGDTRVVHRLDMATSGLMLLARSPLMQRMLSQAFAKRLIRKRYVALVTGHLGTALLNWHEIDLPLMPDWPRRPRQKIDKAGRPSLTRWRLLAFDKDSEGRPCSRLELEPITGRTHQLRIHLHAIGHPILGDTLYASHAVAAACPRLMLHASSMDLQHPMTGQALSLNCPPPF